jgi:16S rRNA (cytosine1402-N4)-methyltransferase
VNDSRAARHEPVLLKEVIEGIRPVRPHGVVVDATVGLGGHARALLDEHRGARLVGIDRDPAALDLARQTLEPYGDRVTLVEGRHEEIFEILQQLGIDAVDCVLADLGVSSMQLGDPARGFSFRAEGPLDMRMGRSGETAADLVNGLDERDLAKILRDWGEEPMARRIARAIVEARAEEPITTTARLAAIVRSVKRPRAGEKIDPATQTFQALRIATNRELEELGRFVDDAVALLVSGGRIGVISFHSLEDRIVKRKFRALRGECTCPPGLPVCGCGARQVIEVLTSRPLTAGEEETARNPRARSARMRVAEKL